MGAAKLSAFNQERWVGDLRVPKIIERIRSHYFPPIKSSKASLARGDDVKTYTLTEAISRINKAQNGGSPVRIVAKLILEGEQ